MRFARSFRWPLECWELLPATKFSLPQATAGTIRRNRLTEALDSGVRRPLTLLAAPPGAGKTALLASWIAGGTAPGPVACLSLDAADADRRRFWRGALQALAQAGGGDAVAALAAHPPRRVELLVDSLGNALADRATPFVLVLDDFHEVADGVHADLDLLLRHPPSALRLVIATRADPPLHLGRLRLEDRLAEIRAPQLAFTAEETEQMLAALGVDLGPAHARRLWERTEGWAGALRLAALSLREHPRPEEFVDDFAGDDRAISDYLLTEVMATLAADDRSFLLRTSIAGELNGELANALTDRTDGHRRLAELARGGALLTPLDRRGEWYRFHSLFAELLRAEMRSEHPEQSRELHRRAAWWLAEHGEHARGLLHAVEGDAWDLAARLAGERWSDLAIQGESAALRPLVDRMPAGWALDDPELALALASVMLERGDHAAAARHIRQAEASAAAVPPERHTRFVVSLASLKLYLARLRGDLAEALETGRTLARDGALEPGAVPPDLRAMALVNLGIAELWANAGEAVEHHLERARGAAVEAGRPWLELFAVAHLAADASLKSDFVAAGRRAREAIALAHHHGWERTWPAGAAYLVLATEQFLGDRVEAATETLDRAQDALATSRERPLRVVLAMLRASVLAAKGRPDTALAVLGAGVEQLGDWPLPAAIAEHIPALEAVLRAELGHRDQAQRLLGAGQSLPAAVGLAQLRLGAGEPAGALAELASWAQALDRERSPAAVQGWMLRALAHDALAQHELAAVALEEALERIEPAGLRRLPLAFGRTAAPLLRRQLRHGTSHGALAGELLATLEGTNGHERRERATLVLEPLSPREAAVLRYLPTMMSNQEIAAELFVSVNTVKTHLKAIYRKLDVPDRREAVRRARTLELLAP